MRKKRVSLFMKIKDQISIANGIKKIFNIGYKSITLIAWYEIDSDS